MAYKKWFGDIGIYILNIISSLLVLVFSNNIKYYGAVIILISVLTSTYYLITKKKLSSKVKENTNYDLSYVDTLTGTYNRNWFNMNCESVWQKTVLSKLETAIIIIDVDYFKQFNDTYGHSVGDKVLSLVGKAIRNSIRDSFDYAIRYGGDEFIVLFTCGTPEGLVRVCDRIYENIKNISIEKIDRKITISAGAVHVSNYDTLKNIQDMIKIGDDALYEAKKDGRACCKIKVIE